MLLIIVMSKLFIPLVVALMAGCSSANDGVSDDADEALAAPSAAEAKACVEATVGKDGTGAPIVHCNKPFATAPFVRLPADAIGAAQAKFYGGMTVPTTVEDIAVIWTRDGERFVPVDAKGKAIAYSSGGSTLPKALHAPTNRITFTLYQFSGAPGALLDTPYGKARAIRLAAARPVVEIDGCAFDSELLGTFKGTVSERLETPSGNGPWAKSFDESKRVPIHVTFDKIAKNNTLNEYKGGTSLSDADTYMLSGAIDNFDKDVTVAGVTYPSLQAKGKKNPFLGAKDGKVQLYRLGNMHGQNNDGHWVLTYPSGSQALTGNGMSYTLTAFTAPVWLMGSAEGLDAFEIKPHIPYVSNGHSVLLSTESIGARAGQCK